MRTRITTIIVIWLIGVVLVVSGCTRAGTTMPADKTSTPTSGSSWSQGTALVRIPGRIFEPGAVHVTVGTTVTWVCEDAESTHTVTSDTDLFNATLSHGKSFNYTFNERGTYSYYCEIHHPYGMSGTVFVE